MHPGMFLNVIGRDYAAERRRRELAEFSQPDAERPAADEHPSPNPRPTWSAWRALQRRSETIGG